MPSQVASQAQCLQNGTNPLYQTQCYHCAVYVLSCFGCVQLFATPWTVACQAPLSIRFSRQVGLPCPPLGYLPDPGIKPTSRVSPALAGGFFTTRTTWETPPQSCSSFLNLLTWRIAPYSLHITRVILPLKPFMNNLLPTVDNPNHASWHSILFEVISSSP